MPDKITFYAVVGDDRTVEDPMVLCDDWSSTAMGLRTRGCGRDFSWSFTPVIVEWEQATS